MTERTQKQGLLIERAIDNRPFLWSGTTLHVYNVDPELQLRIVGELRRHGVSAGTTIMHTPHETLRLHFVVVMAPKCVDCGARVPSGLVGSFAERCWRCTSTNSSETGEPSMKAFHALTNADLEALFQDPGLVQQDIDKLLAAYRNLRDHHVTETTALTKRDRSSILRMAGNIAGGLFADPEFEADSATEVAEKAVSIARAIVAAVDAEEPTP